MNFVHWHQHLLKANSMVLIRNDKNYQIFASQIIDNIHDLAQFLGADTETIVNQVQRTCKSKHRQDEQLTVRAMLRNVCGPDVYVEHTDVGKPILVNCDKSISISHSKSHVVIILSDNCNLGIDIERISNRILKLSSRIALPKELTLNFDALSIDEKTKYLTALWTIKEAVYKSLVNQENIDLLTDIVASPTNLCELPLEVEVKIKGYDNSVVAHCSEFEGNILTYITK